MCWLCHHYFSFWFFVLFVFVLGKAESFFARAISLSATVLTAGWGLKLEAFREVFVGFSEDG